MDADLELRNKQTPAHSVDKQTKCDWYIKNNKTTDNSVMTDITIKSTRPMMAYIYVVFHEL